ncbi:UNVERIFIED_CONTAM: Jasmonoyl--L-amino acid synthetase JAR4 [Sesamum calycinum]|uniref:Jasmonoyl--L-amino acid synthetase JAR4 n=1 Tax=Sesamum calycinum TaxID=2727403 RepID=A0AAW2T0P7_9LAMI
MLERMDERLDPEAVIEEFEALTRDAGRVQRETLQKILEENGEAEYLRRWRLNGRTDPDSFKACVPLVSHKDLEPYIQCIADGKNPSVLTGKPITTISLSSGTTHGKPKFVPFNDELMESTMQIFKTSFAFRNREYPIGHGKALQFIYSSKQFKTKGGLTAGTATTNVYRNAQFKKTMKAMQTPCCSPDEVIFGPDFHQSLYCHLLCGLIFRDEVQVVSSTFAHGIVHAFRTFEQVWEELVTDIREGSLSSRIIVPSIRTAIARLLKPDPELADTIYSKCVGLSNCADYGSSEGWIGANVNPKLPPELATFAVLPDIGYFEFIPLKEDISGQEQEKPCKLSAEPQPVGLTEVKVGEEYEIILTNFAGLYRYRLGDVVKVNGFHNSTPELQFVCRRNLLLTVNIDKNTEKDLQLAVEAAAKLLAEEKLEVVDFTSRVDFSTEPGHYVIFWEISGDPRDEILQECCNCLDRSFIDAGYVSSRKVNTIGPLELRIVKRGTFHKILDHYVGLGAAVSQFKTPRCVGPTNSTVLQILSLNGVKSYFSTAF